MKLPPLDTHFKPTDWDTYQLTQYTHARELCKHYRTAIDIGAHVGIMTHRMCEHYGHVHAYEPRWHDYLEENLAGYTNVTIHPHALSNQRTRVEIHVNETNTGGTSITPTEYPTDHWAQPLDADTIEHVDLIKMDVEGHELQVLQGAEQTIRTYQPILLIELERHAAQRHEVELLLQNWGYEQVLRKNADTVWVPQG